MRAYAPVGWAQLGELVDQGVLPGPLRACTVDPAWRVGAPDVDEEEWEFEAQSEAAAALSDSPGVVLALDPVDASPPQDGWVSVTGPVRRGDVAALLTEDLSWFGVQEAAALLDPPR